MGRAEEFGATVSVGLAICEREGLGDTGSMASVTPAYAACVGWFRAQSRSDDRQSVILALLCFTWISGTGIPVPGDMDSLDAAIASWYDWMREGGR